MGRSSCNGAATCVFLGQSMGRRSKKLSRGSATFANKCPVEKSRCSYVSAWRHVGSLGGQRQRLGKEKSPGELLQGISRSQGARWGETTTLWNGSTFVPRLAMDEGCNSTLLAIRTKGFDGEKWLETRYRLRGSEWSEPVVLTERLGGPLLNYATFDLAVSPSGEAIAAWDEVSAEGSRSVQVATRPRGPDSRWSESISLGGVSEEPLQDIAVAVNEGGRAVVLWSRGVPEATAVQVAERDGGSWQEPLAISNSPDNRGVDVTVDRAGLALTVWYCREEGKSEKVCTAESAEAGQWTERTRIDGTSYFGHPVLATNDLGDALVAWVENEPDDCAFPVVKLSERSNTDDWSAPRRFSESGSVPSLAVDTEGRVVVSWSINEQVVAVQRDRQGAWSTSMRLPWTGPIAGDVRVQTAGGLATIVWRSGVRLYDGHIWAYDLDLLAGQPSLPQPRPVCR